MPQHQTFKLPDPEIWTHPEAWARASVNTIGNLAISGAETSLNEQVVKAFEWLLDPAETLPNVGLIADHQRSFLERGPFQGYDIFSPEGLHVGIVTLMFDYRDNKAFFTEISLGQNSLGQPILDSDRKPLSVKGKGYGLATYKQVIPEVLRQGYGFKSFPVGSSHDRDHGLSRDGYRMWKHLEKAGVARITESGKINGTSENPYSYSTTRFEILSPEDLIAAANLLHPSSESK